MSFFSASKQDEYYFKVGHECFVSVIDKSGKACATLLSSLDLRMGKFEEFIKEATKELNTITGLLTLKAVGGSSLLNSLKGVCKDITFAESKFVDRIGAFEVIFFPNNGVIRVSKAHETANKLYKEVKVLVVDDSKTIRNLLSKVLGKSDDINVVATAEKPSEVEALIEEHKPDVITLDIHMPEMNGVDLLKIIGPKYNIPTIMITSISIEEGPLVLEALENGAFDYIQKPKMEELAEVGPILVEKVIEAAKFKGKSTTSKTVSRSNEAFNKDCLVVIGSSTGGTTALKDILSGLPKEIPPTLIVQHIPAVFSKAFADRMNTICPFHIKEASDGEAIEHNTVYIAPGGQQMKIKVRGGKKYIEVTDDPPVNRFKPSVDYLFESVEPIVASENVISVILTGMGRDGAQGIKKLKDLGALTIAQNEESCVVFGMPKAAIELDGATEVVHKDNIAEKMIEFSQRFRKDMAS